MVIQAALHAEQAHYTFEFAGIGYDEVGVSLMAEVHYEEILSERCGWIGLESLLEFCY